MRQLTLLFAFILFTVVDMTAQGFGRNKPRYRSFDFKVEQSQHFDIHHYLRNREVVDNLVGMSEQWYDYHQQILKDTFFTQNPIIFYNTHAEFQQTNSISGNIGIGTGGVTEAFKNRVVMPLTFSNQSTYQVLGHELVHAFQFKMILGGDSTSIQSLANLPLWLVEGMAEYMTMGRVDPFTAMWMRDAVIQDKIPTIAQMANPRYFPYRYGQALWSYITSRYGDEALRPLFIATAIAGPDIAIPYVLGVEEEVLSRDWANELKTYYAPYIDPATHKTVGRQLLSKENSGNLNVSPAISPDGRYVIYLSEKDLFTTDLFLADARSGKVIRKITSLVKDADLDNINFLESSGTWSPDSKLFAFVAFKKGENVIIIKDADNGKTVEEIEVKGVDALASPNWAPDGKSMVVCGLVEGQPDLYLVNIRTGRAEQLTDDLYSEILPEFSEDGLSIVFSYDKRSMVEGRSYGRYTYDIAEMDLGTRRITTFDVFHTADNLNPQYDAEGNIYFVSDRNGTRDLYRYIKGSGVVYQMTRLNTGISGISRYSPMIDVSKRGDRVVYTTYYDGGFNIYQAQTESFLNEQVDANTVDFIAGTLPMVRTKGQDVVHENLYNADDYNMAAVTSKSTRYKPRFQLDYIGGGAGIGVGNNAFGTLTGLQGGVDMVFSDMLGNNQLYTQLALNGEILDIGGQVTYLNRKNRLAWGVGFGHIPLRTGSQFLTQGTVDGQPALVRVTDLIRIFDESLNAFVHFPFSTTLRLEGGVIGQYRSFRQDQIAEFFDPSGQIFLGEQRERVETGDQIILNQFYTIARGWGAGANIALVGDNSYFGLTSPLAGQRFRLSVERSIGNNDFTGFLADYRKYFWLRPVSLAFRTTGYLRYENESNTLFPLFVGQMGFVRGFGSVFSDNVTQMGIDFTQLIGSKLGVFSFEVRLPFTGPRQLSLIPSNGFFSDLALFYDAGMAFNDFSELSDGINNNENFKPVLAMSAGISMRVNLFGALILEPYYAWPIRENSIRTFGLNFIPGW